MTVALIGDNTGDDFPGTEDARLTSESGSDDTNHDGEFLEIAKFTSGSDETDTVLSFSGISSLPSSLSVSAATLHLFRNDGNTPSYTVDIFRSLRTWVVAEVTWNDFSSGNAWTSGGGRGSGTDRASSTSATFATGTSNGYKISTDMSGLIEDQADGTISNQGYQTERNGTGNNQFQRFTHSTGTDGQRPFLTVTFTTGAVGGYTNALGLMGVG